jgi:predicted permease
MAHYKASQRDDRRRFRHLIDDVAADLRYAARSLSRQPVLASAAILCLAIGVAANATMFDVVDTLLFRPPAGVRDVNSLLWITAERRIAARNFSEYPGVSYPDYNDFATLPEFAGVAAYGASERSFGAGLEARSINALAITHTYMPLLDAKPALGRFFDAGEDEPDGPAVVVLGYAFWQSEFGASPAVLGKTVRIGTAPHVVIGVAPRNFNGVERTTVDVYLPITAGPGVPRNGRSWSQQIASRQFGWLRVIGRARPEIRRERVTAALNAVYRRIDRREPFGDTLKLVVATPMAIVAMHNPQQAQDASVSVWLYAVAVIVLLIACANVANLLLARVFRRRREIAIRLTLGISRARLFRLLGLEAVLLVAAGGALGLLLAWLGGSMLRSTILSGVDLDHHVLNDRVLAVSFVAMALTGLAAGLAPAVEGTSVDLAGAAKGESRASVLHRGPTQTALLVGQIALALVLSVGAALFTQSLTNLNALDVGFDVEHVLRVRANPMAVGYTPIQATRFSQQLAERIQMLPGVARVALASGGPFAGESGRDIWISGRALTGGFFDSPEMASPEFAAVSPDFFETLGMKLRRGRLFTSSDRAGGPFVAVINDEMARRNWPAEDALGKCILIGSERAPCTTIIGIVETARQGNTVFQPIQNEQPVSRYYLPVAQDTNAVAPMLYVRSVLDAATIVPAVRRTIGELEPALPYPDVAAFSTALAPQFRPWRLGATVFTLFGGIALLLAVIGLYGVLAFRVSQRTREIGIRMALGAREGDVRNLVIGQGLRLAALGLVIGIALSLAAGRTANSLLFGISATDPFILAMVCVTILVISAVANYLPARRATRVDPLEALREL